MKDALLQLLKRLDQLSYKMDASIVFKFKELRLSITLR